MKGGESIVTPVEAPVVAAETQVQEAATGLAPTKQEAVVAAGEGNGSQEGWVTSAVRTFTDEQKRKLLGLIAKWKHRLRFDHWRVIVDWDEEPENGDDVTLEVYPMLERHTAHIRVGCWFSDQITDAERENAVVHELLHIHAQPIWETVIRVLDQLSPQAQQLIKEELRSRFEVMIDAIATSFVPLE